MTTSERFLMQQAAALLAAAERKSLQHVTVESCTGGLLASLLTDVEGLSHIFNRAMITYCDEAKKEMAGVPAELLGEHGPVSEQVAQALANGGRMAVTDRECIALAVTGYAGPSSDGGQPGLVFVAASTTVAVRVERHEFANSDRDVVRRKAAASALRRGVKMLS